MGFAKACSIMAVCRTWLPRSVVRATTLHFRVAAAHFPASCDVFAQYGFLLLEVLNEVFRHIGRNNALNALYTVLKDALNAL